jgi:hypothetical protein
MEPHIVPSNITIKIDNILKDILKDARKLVINRIKEEVSNNENKELNDALINKLTDILESDLRFVKQSYTREVVRNNPPTEPVKVRGTKLKLKNINNPTEYRKFCTIIAEQLGYLQDFTNSPFSNLPRNSRIYEAIRILHKDKNLTQEELDNLVDSCNSSNCSPTN